MFCFVGLALLSGSPAKYSDGIVLHVLRNADSASCSEECSASNRLISRSWSSWFVGLLLNDFSLFVVSRSFSQTVVDFDWFCLTYSYSVEPKDFSRCLRKSLCHLERSGEQGCLWEAVEFSFSVSDGEF